MCSSTQECSQLHLGWRTPWAKDRSVAPSETGRIPPQPIEATALTMLGAMREVTLYVARAEDHDQARQEAGAVMKILIHQCAPRGSSAVGGIGAGDQRGIVRFVGPVS